MIAFPLLMHLQAIKRQWCEITPMMMAGCAVKGEKENWVLQVQVDGFDCVHWMDNPKDGGEYSTKQEMCICGGTTQGRR